MERASFVALDTTVSTYPPPNGRKQKPCAIGVIEFCFPQLPKQDLLLGKTPS